MARKTTSSGVLLFKRLIAAALAVIILTLAGLSLYLGANLRRVRGELADTRSALLDAELKELERQAEAEMERLRNAVPPEQAKPAGELSAPEILAQTPVVAHALGAVDDIDGLNCLEGFYEHYNAGVRVFEADLRMTSDGYVVLRHDWLSGLQEGLDTTNIPTLDEFLATPILGQYTPLSFHDLLLLMVQHPDICVITDTKFTDAEPTAAQFRSMLEEAHKLGLSYLFDRIIIQVYSPDHFAVVDSVYHFPHYIYTFYQDNFERTTDGFRDRAIFCQENGIMGITIWDALWSEDYAPIADWRDVKVFTHTVNDADAALRMLRSGVSAVYSDTLTPSDLEE